MVSLNPSVYRLMQSLSLANFIFTLLRINHGQRKGSMRLAFAYVRVDGGGFLISRLLWVLLWNWFYFVIRGENSTTDEQHKQAQT